MYVAHTGADRIDVFDCAGAFAPRASAALVFADAR
jgi:hypothetical protein